MGLRKGPVPPVVPAFAVPSATLDSYAGRYDSAAGPFLIAREGDTLTVKLRFNSTGGKVTSLTLLQSGQELEAKRAD